MRKEKKSFSLNDRRTFYQKSSDFQRLMNKLESLGFTGKGSLTKFIQTITEKEFIILLGSELAISRVAQNLDQNK